jgi:DNA-binding transcriptional regulator LsrR (DeoR family)
MTAQEAELLTRVASLYYLEEATQAEIAAQLGFSRPKVARLLQRARSERIVEITIRTHPTLNLPLETEVVHRFGLAGAVLVADQRGKGARREAVAHAAAEVFERTLGNTDVVAVGMGRNLGAIPEQLAGDGTRQCVFAAAIGGSPLVGAAVNPNDICRRLAERLGGRAKTLYAPAYAESRKSRKALLAHGDVRDTLARAGAADIALVGIGDARDDSAVVKMGCFSTREMARLRKAGAVGDMLGAFFDLDGAPVVPGIGDRVVGLGVEQLRAIPTVIAVASEPSKARAVLGALRTGIVNLLVTTVETGAAVVEAENGRV